MEEASRQSEVSAKITNIKVDNKKNTGSGGGKKYKVEAICKSAIYTKDSENGYLPNKYFLVLWKNYLDEENT